MITEWKESWTVKAEHSSDREILAVDCPDQLTAMAIVFCFTRRDCSWSETQRRLELVEGEDYIASQGPVI
jgi:hypothetical protein